MRILHVFAHVTFYLFPPCHPSDLSHALLPGRKSIRIVLETGGNLIDAILLSEEVRGRAREVSVVYVPRHIARGTYQ